MLLKNRLYLAYQEQAQSVEVISYNDAAGRFEFQIVEDYAPGKTPRVVYARRTLCLSCHQNQGPLFAVRPWSESNANREVAAELQTIGRRYHGVPTTQPAEVALAIDVATDEAALYPIYQRLWQEGCAVPDDLRAQRCRAAIFQAAIQYRLAMRRGLDTDSTAYRNDFMAVQRRQWRQRWPDGLAMVDADIPDRDPLHWQSHVPADMDPLTERFPNLRWSGDSEIELRRVIAGLSEFFTQDDVRRLDAFLHQKGGSTHVMRRRLQAECAVEHQPGEHPLQRYSLQCGPGGTAAEELALKGWFAVHRHAIVAGAINRLRIGDDEVLHNIAVAGGRFSTAEGTARVGLTLTDADNQFHVRLTNGTAIEHFDLSWPLRNPSDRNSGGRAGRARKGHAVLIIMDDFAHVQTAIADLLRRSSRGALDVFAEKPFRRRELLQQLFQTLGMPPLAWCCSADLPMPPPHTEAMPGASSTRTQSQADRAVALFHRHCGVCHSANSTYPPNFLAGPVKTVSRRLNQCAERIYHRLQMWEVASDARAVLPMPPVHALKTHGLTVQQWRASDALEQLKQFAQQAMRRADNTRRLGGYSEVTPYGQLRPCLPVGE